MCLDRILAHHFPDPNLEQDAYKVFVIRFGELQFRFEPWGGNLAIPFDRWIVAEQRTLATYLGGTAYTSGFHCYPKSALNDLCKRWGIDQNRLAIDSDLRIRILPIKVKQILTVGMQDGLDVWVAQQMFVPYPRRSSQHVHRSLNHF